MIKIPTLAPKAEVVYIERWTKKKRRKLQNISSLTSEYFLALFHSKKSKQENKFQK